MHGPSPLVVTVAARVQDPSPPELYPRLLGYKLRASWVVPAAARVRRPVKMINAKSFGVLPLYTLRLNHLTMRIGIWWFADQGWSSGGVHW